MNIAAGFAAAFRKSGREWEREAIPKNANTAAEGKWREFSPLPIR
jgi:hypothetical protein